MRPLSYTWLPRRMRGLLFLPGIVLALAGCVGQSTFEPHSSGWSATLQPQGGTPVRGRVAAVTQFRRTYATIEITEGSPGATYGWAIRHGSCAGNGTTVGGAASYRTVELGEFGSGTAEAAVSEQLLIAGTYHAVLIDGTAEARVLACGELNRRIDAP